MRIMNISLLRPRLSTIDEENSISEKYNSHGIIQHFFDEICVNYYSFFFTILIIVVVLVALVYVSIVFL